jgi:hypothetical protein
MFLCLEVPGAGGCIRYVQFGAEVDEEGGLVRAEAGGEYFMPRDDPGYTDLQRFRLRAFGWTPPTLDRDAPAESHKLAGAEGNWHVDLPLPGDVGLLARLAVRTLRGVFGARTPKDLR